MPTYQTAKEIAENALSTIGAFPPSQSQADAAELRRALKWLEMVLNSEVGCRPVAGFWRIIEIPLEAGVGDYLLSDYSDASETQHVFSAFLVKGSADPVPLEMLWENQSVAENLNDTGTPDRIVVTKDVMPTLKVYPTPVQEDEDSGTVIRLRIQVYHNSIDQTGTGDNDISLRPSWYLWATKRLAYEIGSGPVRWLSKGELNELEKSSDSLWEKLIARDGKQNSGKPPVTQPMAGS